MESVSAFDGKERPRTHEYLRSAPGFAAVPRPCIECRHSAPAITLTPAASSTGRTVIAMIEAKANTNPRSASLARRNFARCLAIRVAPSRRCTSV